MEELYMNQGYGICTDKINTTPKQMRKLLNLAPKTEKSVKSYFKDFDMPYSSAKYMDEFEDYEDYNGNRGIAVILKEIFEEVEDITLEISSNYVYLPIDAPWNFGETEKNLSYDSLTKLFDTYVSILTSEKIEMKFLSIRE